MSDLNDQNDEVVADVSSVEDTASDSTQIAQSQEAVVEDNTVTITVTKRASRIGALVLAGFLGFLIGIVGAGVVHHAHDGRDGRGPGHMRIQDDSRMGPGQGMMPGTPAPAETTN